MNALPARNTEDKESRYARMMHATKVVVPALPLRPVKGRPVFNKAEEPISVENDTQHASSERLPSGGWSTPSNALSIQFGELEGDQSPASFEQTTSSQDVAPSALPSDASNHDGLTQATSSWPSSIPPTLKLTSNAPAHDPQQALQEASVVELPAEARIFRSPSLNISFLYQEDIDSASTRSTVYSGSPILAALPTMSQPSSLLYSEPNLSSAPADATNLGTGFLNSIDRYNPREDAILPPRHMVPSFMISLSLHLLSLFDLQIQCDQQIMVQVPKPTPDNFYFEGHKLILSRAPLLGSLMYSNYTRGNEGGRVTIFWPTGYFNEGAFVMALRYLYSDTVLSIDEIETLTHAGGNQHITRWRASQLMYTITYWLAGLILEAEAVAHQAEAIVRGLVNFDIIGIALTASTELCDHELFGGYRNPQDTPMTHRYRNFTGCPPAEPPVDGDLDLANSGPLGHRRKMFETAGRLGAKLTEIIFGFIASNITFKDFQLDTTLDQTIIKSLLPITRELAEHYRQVPVQTLQFGQFPPQQPAIPVRTLSMRNRYTSYIMLNLPFGNLKEAVKVMRKAAKDQKVEDIWVKEFVGKVIAEREARREIVNLSTSVSDAEQFANMAVWRVVGYEETVVEDVETGEWDVEAECAPEWAIHV